MKKLIGTGVGALLCAVAATAFAASDSDVLYRIGVDANANVAYLWPTDGSWDDSVVNCNDNGVGTVDISTEAGRLVYKTAMAAHLAQHTVKVHYAACAGDFPRIARIDSYAP